MALRLTLGPYLLLALLLGLLALVVDRAWHQRQAEQETTRGLERLEASARPLIDDLHDLLVDLRILAGSPDLRDYLVEPDDAAARQRLAELLAAVQRQRRTYSLLRVIDGGGQELIRIERGVDGPEVTEASRLQNRAGRDYVLRTLRLTDGEIFLSGPDLQVDNGRIEQPLRPVIRAATPLEIPGARALLMINIDLRTLFQAMAEPVRRGGAEPMFLDNEGQWWLHPDSTLTWGRVLGHGQTLPRRHPEVWARLRSGERHWQAADGSTWLAHRLLPVLGERGVRGDLASSGGWLLVRLPAPASVGLSHLLLSPGFWLLQLSGLAVLALIRRSQASARQAREAAERIRVLAQREADDRAWVREQVYQLTLRFQAAQDSQGFAQTVLSELAPLLGVVGAAFYVVRRSRLIRLAQYGLGESDAPLELGLEQGLAAQALRDRRDLDLSPVPPDYVRLRSGFGSGPPAVLRLVPFWVRNRQLGVMELGLLAPLDAQQQALLRQLAPLLALNLDGFLLREGRPGESS
ncbi:MAG TPA: GAF domain-containing protein [Nevskiaceae bacterium]|nr:GAF domain-containing protein [Nevskiaceae bacterium]